MPDIHIHRSHNLGLAAARKIAHQWAKDAEQKLDMECSYAEGKTQDEVSFTRSGASGSLKVGATEFDLHAKLGFLLGAFKGKIEAEIEGNLDQLLTQTKTSKTKATEKSSKVRS